MKAPCAIPRTPHARAGVGRRRRTLRRALPRVLVALLGCPVACSPARNNPVDPHVSGGRLSDRPPVFAQGQPPATAPGKTLVVAIAPVDPEGDAVTVTADGLPGGAIFDGAVLRFTPQTDQSGQSFDVTLTAVDATGASSQQRLVLTVDAECRDQDLDGYSEAHPQACPAGDDCNDLDPRTHPDAIEVVCDGQDNDCRPGTPDDPLPTDVDGDGATIGCGDCNDDDPAVHPGQLEVACDGVDNDCDPATHDLPDEDGDGFSSCVDCDDQAVAVHPRAIELCDGRDNDCDGEVDEDCAP